jgi:hypothetical protein
MGKKERKKVHVCPVELKSRFCNLLSQNSLMLMG